jgi:hypothetical protein
MPSVCALCKNNADLQNSHIIPEFFYKLVYDKKPKRFRIMSANPAEPDRFEQKGLREYLLCRDCEQKLNRWETYAKSAFVDGRGIEVVYHSDAVAFQKLEYMTFKLFQLSLLWRMSVSSLDFFKAVCLGPHEERIRLALLKEDPLLPHEYPCWMVVVEVNGQLRTDWIWQPCLCKLDGFHIYWLVVTGIMFSFYVGSHQPPIEVTKSVLNAQNEMTIPITQLSQVPCLKAAALRLLAAHKSRPKT